ncbi:MAG TPA: hypothetical protein VGR87_10430 [Candidatus Limnocylindria bacterium]|nr:hypothetical protein [Candidatus Limnocylindria bacterium]
MCVKPAHLDKSGALADHITIHEKDWAYCALDARARDHDWSATGGVSLGEIELLVRGMREKQRAAKDASPSTPRPTARG